MSEREGETDEQKETHSTVLRSSSDIYNAGKAFHSTLHPFLYSYRVPYPCPWDESRSVWSSSGPTTENNWLAFATLLSGCEKNPLFPSELYYFCFHLFLWYGFLLAKFCIVLFPVLYSLKTKIPDVLRLADHCYKIIGRNLSQ